MLEPSWLGLAAMGLGLAIEQTREGRRFRRTPLDWPLLLILLMGLVTLWATASPETTSPHFARLIASLAACYGLAKWPRSRQQLLAIGGGLILSGVLLALIAPVIVAWNETKGIPIPDAVYALFPSLASDVVHPNIMATLMVLLLPLALVFVVSDTGLHRAVWYRWLAAGACGLMGIVLILTKSRGGYLAGAAGVIAVLWLASRRRLALLLFLVAAGTSAWLLSAVEQPPPGVVEGVADAGTWAFRQTVWEVAVWMIGDFPFTGVGMGTFNQVAERLYPFPRVSDPGAHNVYFQAAVDLGILGLVAVLALLFISLSAGIKAIQTLREKQDRVLGALAVGATAGMVALMVHGLVDNTVWGTRAMFFPWLVTGFLAAVQMHLQAKAGMAGSEPSAVESLSHRQDAQTDRIKG